MEKTTTPFADTPSRYTVLTQVKSARVIYFTDDEAFVPVSEGDWFYASIFEGTLPEGLSLRNCWSWRFNGNEFIKASVDARQERVEALLDNNRAALRRILLEKIEAVRKPYESDSTFGAEIRRMKLEEAERWVKGGSETDNFPMLEGVAFARALTMHEAAQLIIGRSQRMKDVIVTTERVREQFGGLIEKAQSQKELNLIRNALLLDAYPELSKHIRLKRSNTEPGDQTAPLSLAQLRHEKARLKAYLREEINSRRKSLEGGYLSHGEILKFKAQVARNILAQTGGEIPGRELIDGLAGHRSITPVEVATSVLTELAVVGKTLTDTELIKDRILTRIDTIRSYAEVEGIQKEIEEIGKEN